MENNKQRISLVLGAGGFIGGHLVSKLKSLGDYVIGVDIKKHEFKESEADNFLVGDLRNPKVVNKIISSDIDQVFQLAADMGGSTYINIGEHDSDVMHNSCLINLNVLKACSEKKIKKIFYASSACVYPEFNQEDPLNPQCHEDSVYPAQPDSEYGWEKLFSERLYKTFAKDYPFMEVRIARFHNIYGSLGCYDGGREKAPGALCRKVALAKDGDTIQVLGNGEQTRSFLYIDKCIEGILRLMDSNYREPINIGSDEIISINDFTKMIIEISGKKLSIKNVPYKGIGVMGRNSDNRKIKEVLGWEPKFSLREGIEITYKWILEEISQQQKKKEELLNYDIVIPIGPNDCDSRLIKKQLSGIYKLKTNGKIYLIVNNLKNKNNFKNVILDVLSKNQNQNQNNNLDRLVFLDEKDTFPYQLNRYNEHSRTGWYFQQLIKLEAWKYIPQLSQNYLVVDADTIFQKEIPMLNYQEDTKNSQMYLTIGNEYHQPYFDWMKSLHPSFKRNSEHSGICHHMLFNQQYIKEIIALTELNHKGRPFWKIYLEMVDEKDYPNSGASEYELYFHYMLGNHPDKIITRQLRWENSAKLDDENYQLKDLDYYSYHWYLR